MRCVARLRLKKGINVRHEFLAGVVEGFYGRPWTCVQRLRLFEQLSAWGLNTYFYAPKDDLKHRALWRELYHDAELLELKTLVDACQKLGLHFIYGLSPGLDLRYSEVEERDQIKRRFDQLIQIGCQHFALLFDDLPGALKSADRQAYCSLADAQSAVANDIHRWLGTQVPAARFLFCPTPYCDRMDRNEIAGPGYLETIGQQLESSVEVLWTGPEIISTTIPIESIEMLAARIKRPPVIWDNLHANDYDGQRLYTGPYSGRPLELKKHVGGILVNPNNEFPINFVPLRTLAAYVDAEERYMPREAFIAAVKEWLAGFQTVAAPMALDDLILLCDCYYLPHESGPAAERLYGLGKRLISDPVARWDGAEQEFQALDRRIQAIFEKLTQLQDRELFYAWSRRVWDLKEEMQLISGFLAQKQTGAESPQIHSHLPGTYRGGIVARLRELISMDEQGRFAATGQA
jgi:protein O-GlcNAcase/histone acetyltransferase